MRCHDDHMTCCSLCAPKSTRCVPDPFLLLGVGSGDETNTYSECVAMVKSCDSAALGLGVELLATVCLIMDMKGQGSRSAVRR